MRLNRAGHCGRHTLLDWLLQLNTQPTHIRLLQPRVSRGVPQHPAMSLLQLVAGSWSAARHRHTTFQPALWHTRQKRLLRELLERQPTNQAYQPTGRQLIIQPGWLAVVGGAHTAAAIHVNAAAANPTVHADDWLDANTRCRQWHASVGATPTTVVCRQAFARDQTWRSQRFKWRRYARQGWRGHRWWRWWWTATDTDRNTVGLCQEVEQKQ